MKHFILIFTIKLLLLNCDNVGLNNPNIEDSTPPTINIVYPANQAIVNGNVTISVYAHDNSAVEKVRIFIDDSTIYDNTLQTYQLNTLIYNIYEHEWDTQQYLDDKYYTIRASVKDSSGNYSHANPIQVKIDNYDNIKPNGLFLSPSSGQIINGNVEIILHAEDNDSIDYVKLFIDGDSVETFTGSNLSGDYYHYFWNTLDADEDNLHGIHALIVDISGNHNIIGPINVYVNNQDAPDILSPQGTIVNPPSGSVVHDIVSIDVNAYDNISIRNVDFIINGILTETDSVYPYSYEWNTLEYDEDYDHVINIDIYDDSGNMASLYPIAVHVDNYPEVDITPPTIVIYEPASNQTLMGTVIFSTIAVDNDSIHKVEFYKNYSLIHTDSLKFEPNDSLPPYYTYEWNTTEEADDSQFIWFAKAFDISGNITQTEPLTLFVDNIDNIAPIGEILFPYAGQTVNDIITIQVIASDNISVYSVEFYINGDLEYSIYQSPYHYDWNTIGYAEDQNHIISSIIYDQGGNSFQDNIMVTVDNIPMSEDDTTHPFASILSPISGQTVQDTVFVSGFATDNYSVLEVNFYIDNQLVSTMTDTPYFYLWNTANLEDESEHTIQMIVSDEAGNSSSAQPVLITVDNSN